MHPNVVNVYDVGQDRGLYYMVMELVEGITLKDYIREERKAFSKRDDQYFYSDGDRHSGSA